MNGKVRSWWPNGVFRSESNTIRGVMHGVHRQWYSSGTLFKEMHLNQGKEEGMQRAWRENGKLYNFVEEDLGLEKSPDDFLHTENFVLIDQNKYIRGIYNGLSKSSVQQLIADIKSLKKEMNGARTS